MRFRWQQCDNHHPHAPHGSTEDVTTTICEGVGSTLSLAYWKWPREAEVPD